MQVPVVVGWLFVLWAHAMASADVENVLVDYACEDDEGECSVSLRQLRGELRVAEEEARVEEVAKIQDVGGEEQVRGQDVDLHDSAGGGGGGVPAWIEVVPPNASESDMGLEPDAAWSPSRRRGSHSHSHGHHAWNVGGDKLWGPGSGVESINPGNVAIYDKGMYIAHDRCGGPRCALVVNPKCCRSVHHIHIHMIHYHSYGKNLKRTLEENTCSSPKQWKSGPGHVPCHGSAAFFPGAFPAVFSEVMGSHHHISAGVIAWPSACGGRGTIVEKAPHCSIEHQIRGDYNPNHR